MKKLFFYILLLWSFGCSKSETTNNNLPNPTSPINERLSLAEMLKKNSTLVKTINLDSTADNFEGVKENYIRYINTKGQNISLFLLEIDLSNPKLSVKVATPKDEPFVNTTQTMSNMIIAKNTKSTSEIVIAGINGDFFEYINSTVNPLGPTHQNGVQIRTIMSSGYKFFGMADNGNYLIGNYDDYLKYKDRLPEVIGGRHLLLEDGNIISQTDQSVAPRTSIGLKDSKKAIIMVVDGRQSHSIGYSLEESAQALQAMGIKNAVNLDGGGSSVFIVKNKNNNSYKIKNKPSDGSERAVANGLVVTQKK